VVRIELQQQAANHQRKVDMKISDEVLKVLSEGNTVGKAYFLPAGQLERLMYTKVNKVLEAAGGKWDRKAKAHIFANDAENRIDQIIVTGEVDLPKDEFEFFPTPLDVVKKFRELAKITEGMKILEPSAGRGALINGLHGVEVHCVEKMPENVNFLNQHLMADQVTHADFLAVEPDPTYDLVLMNPPFSKRQDVKHVNHAAKFLKEGGRLVSVMSAGVEFRQDKLTQDFRESLTHIEKLPEGAFKSSGTMVNTVIVVIDK
jgi:predicted RNA methylase